MLGGRRDGVWDRQLRVAEEGGGQRLARGAARKREERGCAGGLGDKQGLRAVAELAWQWPDPRCPRPMRWRDRWALGGGLRDGGAAELLARRVAQRRRRGPPAEVGAVLAQAALLRQAALDAAHARGGLARRRLLPSCAADLIGADRVLLGSVQCRCVLSDRYTLKVWRRLKQYTADCQR